jgi:translation initiation factor 1 (eIF-1/SUI1)
MRKLNVDDIFLLSEIAEKMDFELPAYPEKTENEEKAQREYGMKLFAMLFKKIHKAKTEIKELVTSVSGKSANEMGVKELADSFKQIISQEGALDVFK